MRMRFLYAMAMLFLVNASSSALANDENVACVQEKLSLLGYDPGTIDGLNGRQTKEAADAYRSEGRRLKLPEYDLTEEIALEWCNYFRRAHEVVTVNDHTLINAAANAYTPNAWEVRPSNAMPVRISSHRPDDATVSDVVIYIHGDGMGLYTYLKRCHDYAQELSSGVALVCIWRVGSDNKRFRRQPVEVAMISKSVQVVRSLWPTARLHCVGHSGGGHSCISLAQQPDINLQCVVAASPTISVKYRAELDKESGLIAGRYDPLDHIEQTHAREIIIIGDPTPGGDTVVDPRVWERFIAEAEELPITYQQTPGKGHQTEPDAVAAIKSCVTITTSSVQNN